jgi:hypothetical protein
MSNLKTAIFEQLNNDAAITGIVGSRIYRTLAPQNVEFPFVTYQRISAVHKNDLDLFIERFQFDLIGQGEEDEILETLKDAMLENLNRFKGDLGGTGFKVMNVWLEIIADDYNEDNSTRRILIDFRFKYLRG